MPLEGTLTGRVVDSLTGQVYMATITIALVQDADTEVASVVASPDAVAVAGAGGAGSIALQALNAAGSVIPGVGFQVVSVSDPALVVTPTPAGLDWSLGPNPSADTPRSIDLVVENV